MLRTTRLILAATLMVVALPALAASPRVSDYGNLHVPNREDVARTQGRCDPILDGCGPYKEYNVPFGNGQSTSPPTDSYYFRHADGRD